MISKRYWQILAGLLMLGLWLWLVAPDLQPQEETLAQRLGMEADLVQRVEADAPGGVALELRRDENARWQLIRPFAYPADKDRVAMLLRVLEATPVSQYQRNEIDPVRLGLDKPEAELKLDGLTLAFGKQEPLDGGRFVAVEEQVFVVYEDDVVSLIDAGAPGLLDQRLIVDPDQVAEIRLPVGTVKRSRDAAGGERWSAQPPKLDGDAIGGAWLEARARWISVRDSAGSALGDAVEAPAGRVHVVMTDGSELRFDPGPGESLYRADKRLSFQLDRPLLDRLLGAASQQ